LSLLCGDIEPAWLEQVSMRVDEEAVQWLKLLLEEKLSLNGNKEAIAPSRPLSKGKCRNCLQGEILEVHDPKIMVFMSFSVPENIWLSFSKEMEKKGGIFVIRGLPENSFKSFAGMLLKLKEKGMNSAIQINPKLFREYEIVQVPTVVALEDGKHDRISGNISLSFALERMGKSRKVPANADKESFHEKL
jgi:conjugal transfer pilus assembly protein TrbC